MQFGWGELGYPLHGTTLDDLGAQVARKGSNVRHGYAEEGAMLGAL